MISGIVMAWEVLQGVAAQAGPAPGRLPCILNILIGLGALSISIALLLFVCKRREQTFNWLFLLFAGLIAVSGITNFLDAISIWAPVPHISRAAAALTALVSVTTAALLILSLPKMLALPNRTELSMENLALRRDVLESERRFSDVADTAPARIWMTGPDGLLIYCNIQTEEFYGMPRSELLGLNAPPRVHPEDFEQCFRLWLDAFRRRIPIEVEFRQLRADGEWRWTNAHVVPRFSPEGAFLGYIGLMVDVTERRAAETALADAKRVAEEANRGKDEFIAALSHELRTPLTPVMMIAAMLADEPDLTPDVREQIQVLRRNVEMAVRLIDDLLDVTKFARGKFSVEPKAVSVGELLQGTMETVREGLVKKNLAIHVDIAAKSEVIWADPVRLQQVLWNLIKNAIKFTPEGGHIYCRAFNPDSETIAIEVRDTGAGLAPEMREKIFAPFEQGAATGKAQFGGLGLGLAISKAIVELHGGAIAATSAGLGMGSTFTVTLPVCKAAGNSKPMPGVQPADGRAPLRILLVEDNDDTRTLLARLLEREGHRVEAVRLCHDANLAVEKTTSEPFQALISDLDLPDGNGIELVRQIKQANPAIKALALSGHGGEEDIQKSLDSGFDMHLTKPIAMESLRRFLAHSRQHEERK